MNLGEPSLLKPAIASLLAAAVLFATPAAAETYRGLTIAPEHRCSPYSPDDYPYPQSVKARIVAELSGAIYGPYTGTYFRSTRDTDIEHIVARSEAHDIGLCAASAGVKAAFARDLLNLTLAHPRLNRYQKIGKDVAEWTPAVNTCWFAARTLAVRRKYRLTIDRAEAAAVERILTGCPSTNMVRHSPRPLSAPPVSPVDSLFSIFDYDYGMINIHLNVVIVVDRRFVVTPKIDSVVIHGRHSFAAFYLGGYGL